VEPRLLPHPVRSLLLLLVDGLVLDLRVAGARVLGDERARRLLRVGVDGLLLGHGVHLGLGLALGGVHGLSSVRGLRSGGSSGRRLLEVAAGHAVQASSAVAVEHHRGDGERNDEEKAELSASHVS